VQTFLHSTATRVLLLVLAGQLFTDLVPMLRAHAVDWWALAEGQAVILAGLAGNALRPDVDTPGLNWFNRKGHS
jgi:hypothetical protein